MAIKERKQITGTEAQIKGYAGHNGVLAYAKDTKHLHVLSGTAGTTTELANRTDIPDITGKADTTYVNAELTKKQPKGDYATNTALTQGLAGKANSSHTHTVSQITDMPNVVLKVNNIAPADDGNVALGLHAVATSGNYNDLSNKPKVYVTETWYSGTSWYRVWSDGWIEQGGTKAGALFNGASQTLTLPKAYKNASYIITGIGVYKSGVWGYASIGEKSVTKNSFKYAGMGGASRDGIVNFYWYTCGY